MRFCITPVLIVIIVLFSGRECLAQDTLENDTSYYQMYPYKFVGRVYFSRKFTGFNIRYTVRPDILFKYRPNTTRNLGIGGTYKGITLNLAYGFPFINPDKGQGDTKYLDLQSHIYTKKFNIDLYGQFYKGYYLENYTDADGGVYVRPDIRVTELGIALQYVFNHREFSFRAAFQNTDFQKRSAGSWLAGMSIFYGFTRADSSFAPAQVTPDLPSYDRLNFFKAGPTGGYAHTFVISKHYYITTSVVIGLTFGEYQLEGRPGKDDRFYLGLDGGFRAGAGYNSRLLNIGAFLVLQRVQYAENLSNTIMTGNFRVIAAYRFDR